MREKRATEQQSLNRGLSPLLSLAGGGRQRREHAQKGTLIGERPWQSPRDWSEALSGGVGRKGLRRDTELGQGGGGTGPGPGRGCEEFSRSVSAVCMRCSVTSCGCFFTVFSTARTPQPRGWMGRQERSGVREPQPVEFC